MGGLQRRNKALYPDEDLLVNEALAEDPSTKRVFDMYRNRVSGPMSLSDIANLPTYQTQYLTWYDEYKKKKELTLRDAYSRAQMAKMPRDEGQGGY